MTIEGTGFYKSNYNYAASLVKLMNDPKVSRNNKKSISDFVNRLKAEPVTGGRIKKYIMILHRIILIVGRKDFSDYGPKDWEKVLGEINSSNYSVHTKRDYKISIKKFMRFFEGDKFNPEKYRWINSTIKKDQEKQLDYNDLLTKAEIASMIKATDSPMYKCMIALGYESGMRPSELLSLTINSIKHEDGYTRISIQKSKTKARVIFVRDSDAYIKGWLNVHPLKDDPAAPLFLSRYANISEKKFLNPESHSKMLKLIAEKAGINKRVYGYLLRHSRITDMLNQGWPDVMITKYVGQVTGSKALRAYEHLSEPQLKDHFLKMHDKTKQEIIASGKPTGIECNICHTSNPIGTGFCLGCNRPITNAALMQAEEQRMKAEHERDAFMDYVKTFIERASARDPKLRQMAIDTAREKGYPVPQKK
jgi:integrase/recombinase XerD